MKRDGYAYSMRLRRRMMMGMKGLEIDDDVREMLYEMIKCGSEVVVTQHNLNFEITDPDSRSRAVGLPI